MQIFNLAEQLAVFGFNSRARKFSYAGSGKKVVPSQTCTTALTSVCLRRSAQAYVTELDVMLFPAAPAGDRLSLS